MFVEPCMLSAVALKKCVVQVDKAVVYCQLQAKLSSLVINPCCLVTCIYFTCRQELRSCRLEAWERASSTSPFMMTCRTNRSSLLARYADAHAPDDPWAYRQACSLVLRVL
jgi:hypothetical protein